MPVLLTMGDPLMRRDSSASNVSRREDVNSLPFFYSNFKSTEEVIYKPCHEEICLQDLRQGQTQTRLYNHRRWLEA